MYKIIILGMKNDNKYRLAMVHHNNGEFFWNDFGKSHFFKNISNFHATIHRDGTHWVKIKDKLLLKFKDVVGNGIHTLFNQTFLWPENLTDEKKINNTQEIEDYDQVYEINLDECREQFIVGAGIFTEGSEKDVEKRYNSSDNLFLCQATDPKLFIYYLKDARRNSDVN